MSDPECNPHKQPDKQRKSDSWDSIRHIIEHGSCREDEDGYDLHGKLLGLERIPADNVAKIDYWASLLARLYKLDTDRVKAIYHRCYEIGWFFHTSPFPTTGLDLALRELEPQNALDLFETVDLVKLRSGYKTFGYLTAHMHEPYCTLTELSDNLHEFFKFQSKYRDHIILTGFPKRIFKKIGAFDRNVFWFDWHLGRLYYLKAPVNSQRIFLPEDVPDLFYRTNPELWQGERTEYFTIWVKECVEIDETSQTYSVRKPDDEFVLSYCRIENIKCFNAIDKPVGLVCPYHEAKSFDFVSDDLGSRLEGLREKVFDLRLTILSCLYKGLVKESADNMWDECLTIMRDKLRFDEVQLMLGADRLFREQTLRTEESHPYKILHSENRNAGLSDIFYVISHIEKELTIGTIHRSKNLLEEALNGEETRSYFKLVSKPIIAKVDKALSVFRQLYNKESKLNLGFQSKLNEAISKTFFNKTASGNVNYRKTHNAYEVQMSGYDKFLASELIYSEIGQTIHKLPEVYKKQTDDYQFRNDIGFWIIRFKSVFSKPISDTIGMHYLSYLLAKPNEQLHVSILHAQYYRTTQKQNVFESDCYDEYSEDEPRIKVRNQKVPVDQILDVEAVANLKKRLTDIETEIFCAEETGNMVKISKLEDEQTEIKLELKRNCGMSGRGREFSSDNEKARKSVSKAIRIALANISKTHKSCGEHLNASIETGMYCIYKPLNTPPWEF